MRRLLFYLDWRLALVVLVAAPLVVYPLVRLGQRVRRSTRRGQEELEHVTHLATEAFAGQRIVKAFGAEEREAARFGRATDKLYRTNMKIMGSLAALPPLMEFIGGLAAVGALWYGATRIAAGALTAGEFAAFLAAGLHDVRPDQEAEPCERQHPTDDRGEPNASSRCSTRIPKSHEQPGAQPLARCGAPSSSATSSFAYDDRPDHSRCVTPPSPFVPASSSRSSVSAARARRRS